MVDALPICSARTDPTTMTPRLRSRPTLLGPPLAAVIALAFLYGSLIGSAAEADAESAAVESASLALPAAGSSVAKAAFPLNTESAVSRIGHSGAPVARQIHASVDGDDQHGDGTATRPFASLERARDEIRRWRQQDPAVEGVTEVLFGPGEYPLAETVRLDERDAGRHLARPFGPAIPYHALATR